MIIDQAKKISSGVVGQAISYLFQELNFRQFIITSHKLNQLCFDPFCSGLQTDKLSLYKTNIYSQQLANRQINFSMACDGHQSNLTLENSKYYSQNNRQTHLTREMNEAIRFIDIDPQTSEMNHDFSLFECYPSDKIKFMAKVEVNSDRSQGSRSQIKISKEPIYAQQDVIIFLLILQWFPNSIQVVPKMRKGSFTTEKELKVRFQTSKIQNEDLIRIVYLLSEKIYIEEASINQFVKIIENKSDISYKQTNCLTAILGGKNSRGKMANLASTMDQTRCQYYWYDSTFPVTVEQKNQKSASGTTNNQNLFNKIPLMHRSSSRMHQISPRSPRISLGSRDMLSQESHRKAQLQFDLSKAKKLFSSVQYILTESEVCTQMIIYHLSDSRNVGNFGFKIQTLEEIVDNWPKYCTYAKVYKLNREKILRELIQQAKNNYSLMIQMEFQEIHEKNIEDIYFIINQFNQNVMKEFSSASKEYNNDPEYNEYLEKLENQISNLQIELLNNYGITKKEYGSRILKNIEKKNHKRKQDNYTLMKIIGKKQINNLEIGFKRYKELVVQNYLDPGFEEFKNNKRKKNRYVNMFSENHEGEELNYVQNRIEICQGKKTMLQKAIELQVRQNQSLKLMLNLFEKDEIKESVESETLNF